jgi:hypothetical protein
VQPHSAPLQGPGTQLPRQLTACCPQQLRCATITRTPPLAPPPPPPPPRPIPQLRALAASLFTTGCMAGAGFYALRSAGLLASDTAPMPPPREALRMVLWGGAAAPGAQARGADAAAAAAGSGRGEEGSQGGARAAALPQAGGG